MYFSGTLSIDPSELTHIKPIKPTRVFGKVFNLLTAGALSDKEEHESFTAVSILQQFNTVFRSLGITNLVRLAKDDLDLYLDREGRQDDLKEAMANFESTSMRQGEDLFNTLHLVVEHQDNSFNYVIDVAIRRRHRVGEDPISITINAAVKEFARQADETAEQMTSRIKTQLGSQTAYDSYTAEKEELFKKFVMKLELQIRNDIHVDHVSVSTRRKLIRPSARVRSRDQVKVEPTADPIYHGYYGFGDFFFYSWLWCEFTHDNDIHVRDCDVVDEHGSDVMTIGNEGFNAGETNTLDPDAVFEPPPTEDVEYQSDHSFSNELAQANVAMPDSDDRVLGEVGYSDSFADMGGDDGGGSASSCSSCSSCGGD